MFLCYLHQKNANDGMPWLPVPSRELVPAHGASLQSVSWEKLRKAEFPPGLYMQFTAHPHFSSFSFIPYFFINIFSAKMQSPFSW